MDMLLPDELNPYAPPKANVDHLDRLPGLWREGDRVVLERGGALPWRCVKCNASTGGATLRPRLYYHHWILVVAVIALVIIAFPIALLVALVFRKSAKVEFGLCSRHRRRRFGLGLAAFALLCLAFSLVFFGASDHHGAGPWLIPAALGAFSIALILALLRGQPLRLVGVRGDRLYLKGAGESFRNSLPAGIPDLIRASALGSGRRHAGSRLAGSGLAQSGEPRLDPP